MKKIIIAFSFLLFLNASAKNYENYCSFNHPKKTIGGNVASLSGFNSLSRNIAESVIQSAIKKETGAKFKIKIKNFYGTNILNGEIKEISAVSEKYSYDGIFLSDIKVNTICPYNHIFYEDEKLYFKENMVLEFSAKLTEQDLKNMLASKKLDKNIVSYLGKISNYGMFLPIVNKFSAISLPIKIDENNKGKLKIEKVEIVDNNIKFDSFIIINKNK